MNFREYQARANSYYGATVDDARTYAAIGLAGEVGETLEHVKKNVFRGKVLDIAAFRLELGDVLWYLTALAQAYGLSLSEVAEANIAKLEARYETEGEEETFATPFPAADKT